MDVSVTGFSVISPERYQVGQQIQSTIDSGGNQFKGSASVQSIKMLPIGKTRYGFHCSDNRGRKGGLAEGLQKLSMEMQRLQLRRRSGAA